MIGQTFYHVTPTRNVPRILREGLRRFQPSRWRRAGNGERYGDGEIYAFAHPDDALRWAFKMDWALHTASSTGKISIIEFAAGERPWQVDLNDPLSQAGRRGDWLKSEHPVEPAQIIAVTVALIAKELTFGVETLTVPTEHPGDTVDIDLFIVCATQTITDPLSNWPVPAGTGARMKRSRTASDPSRRAMPRSTISMRYSASRDLRLEPIPLDTPCSGDISNPPCSGDIQ